MPPLPQEKLNRWTIDAYESLLGDPSLDEPAIGKLWEEVPGPDFACTNLSLRFRSRS